MTEQTALYSRIDFTGHADKNLTEEIVVRNAQRRGITLIKCEPLDWPATWDEGRVLLKKMKPNRELLIDAAEASDVIHDDGTISVVSIYY